MPIPTQEIVTASLASHSATKAVDCVKQVLEVVFAIWAHDLLPAADKTPPGMVTVFL